MIETKEPHACLYIPAVPLTSSTMLSNPHLSSLICKMEIIIITTSQRCQEDLINSNLQ